MASPTLYGIFGVTFAANPNARNRERYAILPPSYGPRKLRRKMAALFRKATPAEQSALSYAGMVA